LSAPGQEVSIMVKSTRRDTVGVALTVLGVLIASLVIPRAASPQSPKVKAFLLLIPKARSIDEVSLAFDRAGFSSAEVKEIQAAVSRAPYLDKLKSLAGPPEKVASGRSQVTAKRVVADNPKKRQINARALAFARRLKVPPRTTVRSGEFATKPRAAAATSPAPGAGPSGRITGLAPDTVRVGDRLVISGSGFGPGRGSVELVTPQHRYVCDLESWSDTRIEAIVPAYMESVIGDSAAELRLRVMLRGNVLGPYRDIRLHPPIHDPEVESISSDEVMPGCEIAVEGRWLGGRGTIEFDFGSQLFRGAVKEWTDAVIVASLPDGIGGLVRTRGQIIIRNAQGRESRHPITFEPDKEQVTLTMSHECGDTWAIVNRPKTFDYFQSFNLAEGWLVRSFRKEISWGRGKADYMLEPVPGTTRIHSVITLYPAAFSHMHVKLHVTLEGPKGTPY
jgi:hypothetical protein